MDISALGRNVGSLEYVVGSRPVQVTWEVPVSSKGQGRRGGGKEHGARQLSCKVLVLPQET